MSEPNLNEQLHLVHDVDQAQASAFARVDKLLEWVRHWMTGQGFSAVECADALDNPMMFMAMVRLFEQQVNVTELPYLLGAMVVRIAKNEQESL